MNENLKVNYNSSILEFKRKHNLLVDNAPIKYSVSDISDLSDEELNSLKCGDIVLKQTGNQKHTYIVTYKEENHGICLSYFAAGYTETISYDCNEGRWTYNSKDVVPISKQFNVSSFDNLSNDLCNELQFNDLIKDSNGKIGRVIFKDAVNGALYFISIDETSNNVLRYEYGQDANNDWSLEATEIILNGKPIYIHPITIIDANNDYNIRITMLIFNNNATPFTLSSFINYIDALYSVVGDNIRIMISGAVKDIANNSTIIASFLFKNPTTYGFSGLTVNGNALNLSKVDLNDFFGESVSFTDGVNKIN